MDRAIRIRRIAKWSGLAVFALLPIPILAGVLDGGKLAIWLVFFFALWFTLFVRIRDYRLSRPGCCGRCGYNLTGNVSGVCSGCGSAV